jgi:hypothetical protein
VEGQHGQRLGGRRDAVVDGRPSRQPAAGRGRREQCRGAGEVELAPATPIGSGSGLTEGRVERIHVRIALGRIHRHCPKHHLFQLRRDLRSHAGDLWSRCTKALRDNRLMGWSGKRRSTGQHLVQHATQTVLIAAGVDLLLGGGLFGTHVVRRSDGNAGPGQPRGIEGSPGSRSALERLGDTKVRHHRMATGQQNVLGLYIAMHHAVVMSIGQCVGHLGGNRAGIFDREAAFPLQPLSKGLALDVGHDEVRNGSAARALHHPGIEHREDVRMLQPRHHLDLAKKALRSLLAAQLGAYHLDGHRALVAEVSREIYRRHTTGAHLTLDCIAGGQRSNEAVGHVVHVIGESTETAPILPKAESRTSIEHGG